MKKQFCIVIIAMAISTLMSSCYTHHFSIGEGAKTDVEISAKNQFYLYGLIPGRATDPQKMAGDVKNYNITEMHTFGDGLVGIVTLGIYTPTTTKVRK